MNPKSGFAEKDLARARARGKQLLIVGAATAAGYALLDAASDSPPDPMLALLAVLLLGLGAAHLAFPGSEWLQRMLAYDTRFIDLPNERKLQWAVPMPLRHHYLPRPPERLRQAALIGVALAVLLVILRATDPEPNSLPWPVFVLIPLAVILIALGYAWVSQLSLVNVALFESELIVRSFAFHSTHALTIRYEDIAGARVEPLHGEREERWIVHLVLRNGNEISLGLAGGETYAKVCAFFETKGVQCSPSGPGPSPDRSGRPPAPAAPMSPDSPAGAEESATASRWPLLAPVLALLTVAYFGFVIHGAFTFSGPFRWLCEWQRDQAGTYSGSASIFILVALPVVFGPLTLSLVKLSPTALLEDLRRSSVLLWLKVGGAMLPLAFCGWLGGMMALEDRAPHVGVVTAAEAALRADLPVRAKVVGYISESGLVTSDGRHTKMVYLPISATPNARTSVFLMAHESAIETAVHIREDGLAEIAGLLKTTVPSEAEAWLSAHYQVPPEDIRVLAPHGLDRVGHWTAPLVLAMGLLTTGSMLRTAHLDLRKRGTGS